MTLPTPKRRNPEYCAKCKAPTKERKKFCDAHNHLNEYAATVMANLEILDQEMLDLKSNKIIAVDSIIVQDTMWLIRQQPDISVLGLRRQFQLTQKQCYALARTLVKHKLVKLVKQDRRSDGIIIL